MHASLKGFTRRAAIAINNNVYDGAVWLFSSRSHPLSANKLNGPSPTRPPRLIKQPRQARTHARTKAHRHVGRYRGTQARGHAGRDGSPFDDWVGPHINHIYNITVTSICLPPPKNDILQRAIRHTALDSAVAAVAAAAYWVWLRVD